MSGAHDQARDAAGRLLAAVRYEAIEQGHYGNIIDLQADIETVAEYLGVKEEQA